jgi:hypothetical protein
MPMDPESMGSMIADKFGQEDESEDRDLSPEEVDKHGEAAARHFAESMAKHDHAGMFAAFKAMDALCEESMDEGEPEGAPSEE